MSFSLFSYFYYIYVMIYFNEIILNYADTIGLIFFFYFAFELPDFGSCRLGVSQSDETAR